MRRDMPTTDTRSEQMFPRLDPEEINRLRRFGDIRRCAAGERLFVSGDVAPGMFLLISGSVRVTWRDPLGHGAPIVEQGLGEFVAEVGQLSGRPAFVDVHAIDNVEALLIPPENLRALMIKEGELGEKIMRALILRRVALVEAGASGPVLIGPESSPDMMRLQGFCPATSIPIRCSIPQKTATRLNLSSDMPRMPRTCRSRSVRKDRSSRIQVRVSWDAPSAWSASMPPTESTTSRSSAQARQGFRRPCMPDPSAFQ